MVDVTINKNQGIVFNNSLLFFLVFFASSFFLYSEPKILSLDKVLTIAASDAKGVLDASWDVRQTEMSLEAMKTVYWPKADIQTNFNYLLSDSSFDFFDSFNSSLHINWNIFNILKNKSQLEQAKKNLDQAFFKKEQVQILSQSKSVALFFQYWIETEKENIAKEEYELYKQKHGDIEFSLQHGTISENECILSRDSLDRAFERYQEALRFREEARRNLFQFLFISENDDWKIQKPALTDLPPLPELSDLLNEILSSSLLLQQAGWEKKAAETALKATKFHRWTQFNSSVYFSNVISLDEWDWEKDREGFYYGIGIGWRIPLLTYGEYKRKRKQAEIGFERAKLQELEAEKNARLEIENRWHQMNAFFQQWEEAQKKIEYQQKIWELTKERYQKGIISQRFFENEAFALKKLNSYLTILNYQGIIMRADLDSFCGLTINWLTGCEK